MPPNTYKSKYSSVSSILPQSSSDLGTDQGDIIDEAIKQVALLVNQMLLKTSTGNPTSNLTQNDLPHNKIQNSQFSTQTQVTFIQKQTHNHFRPTDQPHLKTVITHPVTNFEQAKQIIMNIDALSHSPTPHHKILQEFNLNGLCKNNNTYQSYLYKNSNKMVNCPYILVFLKKSTYNAITPDTHQWYRINANKITDNHKIALCNDLTDHMVPLSSVKPSEVNAVETVARLTLSQIYKDHPNNTGTQSTYFNSTSTNDIINNSPQNNSVHPHDQSTVILYDNTGIKKFHRQSVW